MSSIASSTLSGSINSGSGYCVLRLKYTEENLISVG